MIIRFKHEILYINKTSFYKEVGSVKKDLATTTLFLDLAQNRGDKKYKVLNKCIQI